MPAPLPSSPTLNRMVQPVLPRHLCVYCGSPATTRDHVPPRLLLERPFPANLRTVPSCLDCNRGPSKDEEYFLALIAQVSLSPYIAAKLQPGGSIDRAFNRSPALEERFLEALGIDEETGKPFIRPDYSRVDRVVTKIAVGLFALRYGWAPSLYEVGPAHLVPYELRDDRPNQYFIAAFTERFRSRRWRTVQPGVFSYIFVRDPMHFGTVWCMVDIHRSFWGVVHLPLSQRGRVRSNRQLQLFGRETPV